MVQLHFLNANKTIYGTVDRIGYLGEDTAEGKKVRISALVDNSDEVLKIGLTGSANVETRTKPLYIVLVGILYRRIRFSFFEPFYF